MKEQIRNILPPRICAAVEEEIGENILEEIRIIRGRQAYIVASGKNFLLPIIAQDSEMTKILNAITRNSLYAYKDTINKGYLTFQDLRIGIIGKAGVEAERITGVYDISEFSIRIPLNIIQGGASATIESVIVLEGDHTDKDITFFEGLKSVGQDTDEISVSSTNSDNTETNITKESFGSPFLLPTYYI